MIQKMFLWMTKINDFRGYLIDVSALKEALDIKQPPILGVTCSALFSKLNKPCFGYFDPANVFQLSG